MTYKELYNYWYGPILRWLYCLWVRVINALTHIDAQYYTKNTLLYAHNFKSIITQNNSLIS